jgi:hypothetical protein
MTDSTPIHAALGNTVAKLDHVTITVNFWFVVKTFREFNNVPKLKLFFFLLQALTWATLNKLLYLNISFNLPMNKIYMYCIRT